MSIALNHQQVENLLIGSSLFSTGGGVPIETQRKLFDLLYREGHQFVLKDISEFTDNEYVCTCYVVGSTSQTGVDLSAQIRQGIQILQKILRSLFSAIFAGEINVEALAFQSASLLDLPILDADCCGGRAVPEIQMDNVVLSGREIVPLVAVNQHRETLILNSKESGQEVENEIRHFSDKSNGPVAVLDHPMKISVAKLCLELGTLSRSLKVGALMRAERTQDLLSSLSNLLHARIFMEGKINNISLTENKGFLIGEYEIRDQKGNIMKVFVKNENIIGWLNGEVVLTGPDLLVTLNAQSNIGVHNGFVRAGQDVVMLGIPATQAWRTYGGINAFHPKHFGFDFDSKLLPIGKS